MIQKPLVLVSRYKASLSQKVRSRQTCSLLGDRACLTVVEALIASLDRSSQFRLKKRSWVIVGPPRGQRKTMRGEKVKGEREATMG